MPQKVYNNIEGHRLIDNERVVEDVSKIGLPNLKHPTTTFNSSGMAMDVDIPNSVHLEAAEFTVVHNNGVNCRYLASPGRHMIELRTARQKYNVAAGEMQHESVKYRMTGIHSGTEKGDVETGNPYGSTETYSLLRYEEEIDGEVVTIVDAMAGIIRFNGVDCLSEIESILG